MEEIGMMKKLVILLAVALLATGAYAQTPKETADNNPPDHSGEWQVPAGARTVVQIAEDFGGGVPPAGWQVVDNGSDGPNGSAAWSGLGEGSCVGEGNYTNGEGNCACSNTDAAGSGVEVDTELKTEGYDYSGASNSILTFTANYQNLAGSDFFEVDYSCDNGATWTNILTWNEDHGGFFSTPGEDVNLDTSALDGQACCEIRYHYYDPNSNDFDWYIQVDDHVIEADGTVTGLGGKCEGGDGGGEVPATTGIGIALVVLLLGGGSAYFMRRK
jgi:hypothetical protein